MYCIHCGVQNPDNANFCLNCGKELVAQPAETAEPQPKVHHPWMTEQPTQEQVQLQPQPRKRQERDKGEMPEALKSILDRVKGWSTTKKVVWGVVVGFLFLVCAAAIAGESVEEESTVAKSEGEPVPTLGVSFNDIKSELEDEWKFDFESPDKSNGISEIRGESEDIRATLLIKEVENGITELDARLNITGIDVDNATVVVSASMLFFGDMTRLVLPDWDGAPEFAKAIEDSISDREPLTEAEHDNGRIAFEFRLPKELVLTITAEE